VKQEGAGDKPKQADAKAKVDAEPSERKKPKEKEDTQKGSKDFVRVIKTVRSEKTGAYLFKEAFVHKDDVNAFIQGDPAKAKSDQKKNDASQNNDASQEDAKSEAEEEKK